MEQQQFKCTGDCLKCHSNQRQYCSAQFTYNTMRMVEDLFIDVSKMAGTIQEIKTKLEAIQGNEALLFDPTETEISEQSNQSNELDENHLTQEGDGVENRDPQNYKI